MTARILLVDNYDSFTFNLVQLLRVLGAEVTVHRNDQVTVDDAFALEPTHVVISPGPGRPEDAGISLPVIERALERRTPLLGVCLGHQALAMILGGAVRRAAHLMHGKDSPVFHDGRTLYSGLDNPFTAARYHSLIVEEDSLPADLAVSAYTEAGEVMGIRHRNLPAEGVQFHPESILTPQGEALLANFLAQGARS